MRALAFRPQRKFASHLGMYVATLPLSDDPGPELVIYNAPGNAVAIHPAHLCPNAAFIFRAPRKP